MQQQTHSRIRRSRKAGMILVVGSLFGLTACDLQVPANMWVNVATSASTTAANTFASALMNAVAEQVFGTTGTSGTAMTTEEEDDGHDDEH